MRARFAVFIALATLALPLTACNKSSPPPQEPVKPRSIASIDMPLRLPAP